MRDYIPSPRPRLKINLVLELSVDVPQRRFAVNLFAELNVGVDLATRGEWLEDVPHIYFYVNWRANVPKIFETWSNLTAVRPGKPRNSLWEGQKAGRSEVSRIRAGAAR